MTDHDHTWWHYYWCRDESGYERVWDDPFEGVPENIVSDGYACWCGEQAK